MTAANSIIYNLCIICSMYKFFTVWNKEFFFKSNVLLIIGVIIQAENNLIYNLNEAQ